MGSGQTGMTPIHQTQTGKVSLIATSRYEMIHDDTPVTGTDQLMNRPSMGAARSASIRARLKQPQRAQISNLNHDIHTRFCAVRTDRAGRRERGWCDPMVS